MPTQAIFDGRMDGVLGPESEEHGTASPAAIPSATRLPVELSLHHDLASIESDWRAFEESADCTVFQTFDWLSTWFRNIGAREGVKPAVVIGRHAGSILFLLPFALETKGFVRKITWLGSYLCNYNGPVLARDFSRRISPPQFSEAWREVQQLLRKQMGHDLVDLEKMPELIGEQANPFVALGVTPHVNDAYLTMLSGDWESYYASKRSSSTRRNDRKKRKRMADHGEI